ncbi:MAG: GIY-YIG nuclease family protein [Acetobacterium sp.]
MKMDQTKKESLAAYKERKIVGGIYIIRNSDAGKILLGSATDLPGRKNRFDFSKKTNSCVDLKLQKDWIILGKEKFVFEVLEELEKGETQSMSEFKEDIDVLKLLWMEKLAQVPCY